MHTKKLKIAIICLGAFLASAGSVCAMNLDGVKEHFLKSEWKDAIREGEALLAGAGRDSADLDQLYYYLGLSYFKDGNTLRSADIFEIILKEFPGSKFAEPARNALNEAKTKTPPARPAVNESQAKIASEQADDEQGPDLVLSDSLKVSGPSSSKTLHWVQVGAFSRRQNADKLALKLFNAGYTSSVSVSASKHGPVHKVRVGSFPSRQEARQAADKLSRQGYPTKVIP
jgi:hypothetical protein